MLECHSRINDVKFTKDFGIRLVKIFYRVVEKF